MDKRNLRIKQYLADKGISQSEAARLSGVNQTNLCRIVNGLEQPFSKRGKRIADAIGWTGSVDELFSEVE